MNWRAFLSVWTVYLVFCMSLSAQKSSNPFELQWRLPETESIEVTDVPAYENPFDVVDHVVPIAENDHSDRIGDSQTDIFRHFGKGSKSFLVWLTFFVLGYLAFIMTTGRAAITKAWSAFLNPNQFILLFRDWTTNQLLVPYLLLYGNFILNAALFLYLCLRIVKNYQFGGIGLYLACLLCVGLLFFAKHFLVWIAGNIYPVKEHSQKYNFLMSSANVVIGLFLIPFNLLISFVPSIDGFVVFWGLSLFAILFFLRSFRAMSFGAGIFASDKFHFLLYLCALEIMPLLIVAKLIWDYIL